MKDFVIGFFFGIAFFIVLNLVIGQAPTNYKDRIDILKQTHRQEITNINKAWMVRMVKAGAARWVVANDGSTSWTETRKCVNLKKIGMFR